MSNFNSSALSFRGYNYIVKGIVVKGRDQDTEMQSRVQVRIPAFHGNADVKSESSADKDAGLPWAQVCTNRVKAGLFNLSKNETLYPDVGDVVWIMFEGGDIRKPVCIGILGKKELMYSGDSSYYVQGGNLAEIAARIIISQEGGYTSYNGDDNGALSIGKIQWHAGRAKDLLKDIRAENPTNFDTILSNNNASDLGPKITGTDNWSRMTIASHSDWGKAIIAILGTSESTKVQDLKVQQEVQGYLDYGKEKGITDNDALIYFADLVNQYGSAGAARFLTSPPTLDNLFNATKDRYPTRRQNVYNEIVKLRDSGALNPTIGNSTNLPTTTYPGGTLAWPVPGFPHINYYWRDAAQNYADHTGIDIGGGSQGSISNAKAVAVADGEIIESYDSSSGYGNHVILRINGYDCVYGHFWERKVEKGQHVRRGDVLGLVGSTGNSTGPHLHFEIRPAGGRYGTDINPLSLLGTPT